MTTHCDSILFISGAGLGAWIWNEVRDELGTATAVAPRPSEGASAPLVQYAEAAVASAPRGEFSIVAHSIGGVVAAEVARLAHDRVRSVLAVAATIPRGGQSFISAMPVPKRWMLSTAMRVAGTRPPDKVIRAGLSEGLPAVLADRVVAEFTAESPRLYSDRTTAAPWPARRGYIATTRDRELAPTLQGRFAQRLEPSWRGSLDTGHLPMLVNPSALARAIEQFLAS